MTQSIKTNGKYYTTDEETFKVLSSLTQDGEPSEAFMMVYFLGLQTGRIQEVK